MILNKEDIEYLKSLSDKWDLKFREPITVGTYRWYLFMYTNLYNCDPLYKLIEKDRKILIKIFKNLKPEHKLTWIRHKMYEASHEIEEVKNHIDQFIVGSTDNIREFRVALFFMHCLDNKDYVLDDYMIETFKYLDKYRR